MSSLPDLSVIIVNWNTRELLGACLQSLYDTVIEHSVEIWVVDNASVDGSSAMVRERFPSVCVIANDQNVGFVRANNQALRRCRGRYMLLLNSDTLMLPGSLDAALGFMDQNPQVGLAGARLLNRDGSFQASHTPFPTLWSEFLILTTLGRRWLRPEYPSCGPGIQYGPQSIRGYVEGAFLLARREAVEQIGELDEQILMYAEEVDWCYRLVASGWAVWYLPQVTLIHYGGQSTKRMRNRMEAELYRSRVYFFRKHYGGLAAMSLKLLIYAATLTKIGVHGALRAVTRGRRGRTVTGWRELRRALAGIDGAR